MLRNRRRYALLLTVFLVLALTSSALFLMAEADHDCIGEDCPVCQQLCICAQTLQLLSLALLVAVLTAECRAAVRQSGRYRAGLSAHSTLVSQKVKLTC